MTDSGTVSGFAADTSNLPEQYLDAQGRHLGTTFDVLIVCNVIFHEDRVLLFHTTSERKSWANKIGVPMYRLARPEDENDVASLLRSRIDRGMDLDVTVEEYGRVACRTQVGLDPAKLQNSRLATALHTAVSPAMLEDSVWLRASLLWTVEHVPQLKPDDYVCREVLWATAAEVEEIPSEDFLMSVKEDIQAAFELRQRR
ncbi:hypothetical protein M409DRAFT_22527 [Zasmidium cellare ATCC 36951]|uniref:Nudix hydrolase domain-containing protein n=1 Tax=Zasmidium cellare ATCC 36951 TaxID=1080233 RepID=A0A6A6CKF6_ZASCE|nr:uncharacterized protein M409DRAFT_22527 [Zasmidium cellare ATCC 36951]KAF2167093.1 hypothetical protein M409DRAFT_22527 [Zasmidium cellare ATCC 36951]